MSGFSASQPQADGIQACPIPAGLVVKKPARLISLLRLAGGALVVVSVLPLVGAVLAFVASASTFDVIILDRSSLSLGLASVLAWSAVWLFTAGFGAALYGLAQIIELLHVLAERQPAAGTGPRPPTF